MDVESPQGRRGSLVEPPTGKPKFPHLDGIRGLAALGILGYHAVGSTYGSVTGWVQMADGLRAFLPFFFLLSAFLLYRPFVVARMGDGPRPEIGMFWWRRILRIVPAYWVALTLAALFIGLKGVFGPDGWRYYTFLYLYSPHTVTGGLEPAWTLCVDMSFYLMLPLFAGLMDGLWRRFQLKPSMFIELGVLAAVWLGSTAYWYVFVNDGPLTLQQLMMREWNLIANLNWFVLGMALAVISAVDRHRLSALTRLLSRRHAVSIAWGAALLTFVLISRSYYAIGETTRHMLFSLMCVLIFAPAALVGWRGGVQRILAIPRLAWLGMASYGIYLYHAPLQAELRRAGISIGHHGPVPYLSLVAISMLMAIGLSAASYYLLERPLLRAARAPLHATRDAVGAAGSQIWAAGAAVRAARARLIHPA